MGAATETISIRYGNWKGGMLWAYIHAVFPSQVLAEMRIVRVERVAAV